MLTVPEGVQARDADGGNLQEIVIVPTDTVNLTETHDVADNTTSAFLFGQYAYRVEPAGATFDPPITLTFNIPRDVWATLDTTNMSVMWQDTASGAWETIPLASIDEDETHIRVSAAITHFSIYELFMPRLDQATPAMMPVEPTTSWFLLLIVPIAIGTILYLWRKTKQNQDQNQNQNRQPFFYTVLVPVQKSRTEIPDLSPGTSSQRSGTRQSVLTGSSRGSRAGPGSSYAAPQGRSRLRREWEREALSRRSSNKRSFGYADA
jgi:hypothetical protein